MYNLQLETFIVVADLGSFNKAAEALYITPPAVTKQINLLEKDLGLKLFIRTHRGLALTEAGKSLYKDAKYIIQYCKESVERAKKAMQEKDNIIRIGTSPMTPAAPPCPGMGKGAEAVSGYQASDAPLYEQPGKCQRDPEESGQQH